MGNLGEDMADKSKSCDFEDPDQNNVPKDPVTGKPINNGVRNRCAAYSSNLLCDPRFQLYADRHNYENFLQERS